MTKIKWPTKKTLVKMPAYCCICRQTPADYDSLYRFPQNPECRAVWEEKFSAVKI